MTSNIPGIISACSAVLTKMLYPVIPHHSLNFFAALGRNREGNFKFSAKNKMQEFSEVVLDNKINLNLPHCVKCPLSALVVLSRALCLLAAVQYQLQQKCISVFFS